MNFSFHGAETGIINASDCFLAQRLLREPLSFAHKADEFSPVIRTGVRRFATLASSTHLGPLLVRIAVVGWSAFDAEFSTLNTSDCVKTLAWIFRSCGELLALKFHGEYPV